MRLLIEGCAVLDPQQPWGYTSDQYITIEDNHISAVTNQRPQGDFERVIAGRDRLAIPGLINAHTHSPENILRATTDCMPLEPWLVHLYGTSGLYGPRDYYLSVMLGAIEMLRSGVTGVVDHLWMNPPLDPTGLDAAMQAYRDSGMRAAVAPLYKNAQLEVEAGMAHGYPLAVTFFAQQSQYFLPTPEIIAILEDFIKRWGHAEGDRLRCFVGPVGLHWVTEELLRESLALARRYQTGLQMHLLETYVQDWACRQHFGKSGVAWLAEQDLLGPEVSLPHSVWVAAEDIHYLAEAGASVVHNPAANLKLGSGLAPIRAMLEAGVNVALGTDGSASSDNQVVFEIIRLAAMIHNPAERNPHRWVSAREAVTMATEAGAAVLGLAGRLGKLEAGYLADLTLLDLASPHLAPLNDAYRHLVFCESGASVRTVIVDGRVVMHEGRIELFDEAAIIAEAREMAKGRPHLQPPSAEIKLAIERFAAFQQGIMAGK